MRRDSARRQTCHRASAEIIGVTMLVLGETP